MTLEEAVVKLLHDNWALTGDLSVEKVLFTTGPPDRTRLMPQVTVSESGEFYEEWAITPYSPIKAYVALRIAVWAWRPKGDMQPAKEAKDAMAQEVLRILKANRRRIDGIRDLLFTTPPLREVPPAGRFNVDEPDEKPPIVGYQLTVYAVKVSTQR